MPRPLFHRFQRAVSKYIAPWADFLQVAEFVGKSVLLIIGGFALFGLSGASASVTHVAVSLIVVGTVWLAAAILLALWAYRIRDIMKESGVAIGLLAMWLLSLLASLSSVGVVAYFALIIFELDWWRTTVPSLAGLRVSEAREVCKMSGLEMQSPAPAIGFTTPADDWRVVSQVPAAGGRHRRGTSIGVTAEPVVPGVRGLMLEELVRLQGSSPVLIDWGDAVLSVPQHALVARQSPEAGSRIDSRIGLAKLSVAFETAKWAAPGEELDFDEDGTPDGRFIQDGGHMKFEPIDIQELQQPVSPTQPNHVLPAKIVDARDLPSRLPLNIKCSGGGWVAVREDRRNVAGSGILIVEIVRLDSVSHEQRGSPRPAQ